MQNKIMELFKNQDNEILTIKTCIIISLIVFVSIILPSVPSCYFKIFDNRIIQFILFMGVGYLATIDIVSAIIITIVILVILQHLSVHKITNNIIDQTNNILNLHKQNYQSMEVKHLQSMEYPQSMKNPQSMEYSQLMEVRHPQSMENPQLMEVRHPQSMENPQLMEVIHPQSMENPQLMEVIHPQLMENPQSIEIGHPQSMEDPQSIHNKIDNLNGYLENNLNSYVENTINIKHPVLNKTYTNNQYMQNDPYVILNGSNFNELSDDTKFYNI